MGDRISISFTNGSENSVAFFSHWDGKDLLDTVGDYLKERFGTAGENRVAVPLDRKEPETVMVDFISWFTKGQKVESNYYLGKDEHNGDNSDNGHFTIDLRNPEAIFDNGCPECHSDQIETTGIISNSGQQVYKCKDCSEVFEKRD